MDCGKDYVKMCGKAEEIQLLHREEKHEDTGKWIAGDFWTTVFRDGVFTVCGYRDAWSDEPMYLHHPIECIWLPRQDQLQEMIKGAKHMHLLAYEFALYFHGNIDPLYANLGMDNYSVDADNSMEQMWMAFIMKRKYNKIWDNENWKEVTNELDKYTKS